VPANLTEHRKFPRFFPPKQSYAAQSPDLSNLGTIKDISEGGLSVEYMLMDPKTEAWDLIDILNPQKNFRLSNLSCQVVWDRPVNEAGSAVIGLRSRLCGLRLMDLTTEQHTQLKYFLSDLPQS
jgi:hypothetical protein